MAQLKRLDWSGLSSSKSTTTSQPSWWTYRKLIINPYDLEPGTYFQSVIWLSFTLIYIFSCVSLSVQLTCILDSARLEIIYHSSLNQIKESGSLQVSATDVHAGTRIDTTGTLPWNARLLSTILHALLYINWHPHMWDSVADNNINTLTDSDSGRGNQMGIIAMFWE